MKVNKINIKKIFIFFLLLHLTIWALIPGVSNHNLPLDTIEALAWGSSLDWGFNKHPPLSAFAVELIYQIFGSKDWAYYFLSQLFVISSFFIVFKFSQEFFKNNLHSLISVLLLEGIYFYNFTTPEFNVNVCQLPFWALSVLYCWKGLKDNKNIDWLLFGLFAGLGILSKYLFLYLLLAIDIYFIYLLIKKRINFKCLISLITFFLVLTPHLIWLVDNDYTTIYYGLQRTDVGDTNFINHFTYPFIFLGKQVGILIPFILLLLLVVSKVKIKFNLKDKKLIFLLAINILPIILMFLSSLFLGTKIRTMWMTPFYLFFGVLVVYIYQKKISLNKIKYFSLVFLVLFIFSPTSYYYISVTENNKRTDYPGKKISRIVQTEWEKNFKNEILVVAGDEWHGGNLSYHLKSRPIWDNILNNKKKLLIKDPKSGIIVIGEADILSKICKTVFLKVENQGICMLGVKK